MKRLKQIAVVTTASMASLFMLAPPLTATGWPTFDFANWTMAGKIWHEDISTGAKIVKEINQAIKLYTVTMASYQLARGMAVMIQHPQRAAMIAVVPSIINNATQNRYGETVNWSGNMNGGFTGSAWGNSVVVMAPNPYLAAEHLGSSLLLAKLASAEATDGASQKCMQVLSNYQRNQGLNQSPVALLKAAGLDISPTINAMVAQMNLQNSHNQQIHAEQLSQGQIQACLAEQQMLANKYQRDEQVAGLNFIGELNSAQAQPGINMAQFDAATQGYLIP